jgi:hypothetical protein
LAESPGSSKEVQSRNPTFVPLNRPEKLPRPFHLGTFVGPTDITNRIVSQLDDLSFVETAGLEGGEKILHVEMPGGMGYPLFLG